MNKVTEICGEFPENFKKIVFGNDPNFVFENDPNFPSRLVWDSEGNSVVVNSFVECENYVTGGWDVLPIQNYEILLQNWFIAAIVATYIVRLAFLRITKINET